MDGNNIAGVDILSMAIHRSGCENGTFESERFLQLKTENRNLKMDSSGVHHGAVAGTLAPRTPAGVRRVFQRHTRGTQKTRTATLRPPLRGDMSPF